MPDTMSVVYLKSAEQVGLETLKSNKRRRAWANGQAAYKEAGAETTDARATAEGCKVCGLKLIQASLA